MGKVINIQRFCVDDGPGIRTTVFLSGCNMKCLWCHNPESWRVSGMMFYYPEKCISCGRCAKICSCHRIIDGVHIYDRTHCVNCGKCQEIGCGALQLSTKELTAQEVIDTVMKDQKFYITSGGGVTFSGGEPMVQFSFLKELLVLAKQNSLHICLETAGYADTEKYLEILDFIDLFLFDYKMTDEEQHIHYTGVSNRTILHNLDVLAGLGKKIVLRCIVIPTVNDQEAHLEAIGRLAEKYDSILAVNLEPYHTMGNSKRNNLGIPATLPEIQAPSEDKIQSILSRIKTRKVCL